MERKGIKMRRILSGVLVFCILFSIAGCSNERKPNKKWSEDAVDACKDAISVIEEVIEGTMDSDKAERKLETIAGTLDEDNFYDGIMASHISIARNCVFLYGSIYSTTTKNDLEEEIKELEDLLYN